MDYKYAEVWNLNSKVPVHFDWQKKKRQAIKHTPFYEMAKSLE
jgi:hypothetical protein